MKMTWFLELLLNEKMCYVFLCLHMFLILIKCDYEEIPEFAYVVPEERPMPKEIAAKNKTEYEIEMEDCMKDYVICDQALGDYHKHHKICATNVNYEEEKIFENLCHMLYENCKGEAVGDEKSKWSFLNDGLCE